MTLCKSRLVSDPIDQKTPVTRAIYAADLCVSKKFCTLHVEGGVNFHLRRPLGYLSSFGISFDCCLDKIRQVCPKGSKPPKHLKVQGAPKYILRICPLQSLIEGNKGRQGSPANSQASQASHGRVLRATASLRYRPIDEFLRSKFPTDPRCSKCNSTYSYIFNMQTPQGK